MRRAHLRLTLSAAALLASATISAADDGPGMVFRGTVIDERGTPVAGAAVDLFARGVSTPFPTIDVETVRSGPDGRFILRTDQPAMRGASIRAMIDGGEWLGFATSTTRPPVPPEPMRVVLKPSRPILVRVYDAAGKPVVGAAVEVVTSTHPGMVDPGLTDEGGTARFRVPADAPFGGVAALKEGIGADVFVNRSPQPGALGPPPAEVILTLDGARTVTLRAVGTDGRPISGAKICLTDLFKRSNPTQLFPIRRITEVTTDAAGLARWGWVPKECSGELQATVDGGLIARVPVPRLRFFDGGDLTLTVHFERMARLSGRVTNADGSPARGVVVEAAGWSKESGFHRGSNVRTGEDGSYSIEALPGRSYLMAVTGPDRAAKPMTGIVVGEGEHRDGLDFRLIEGTRLHGRVATRPGSASSIAIQLLGPELPADWQEIPGIKNRERLVFGAKIDDQGQYEARLGPGEYEIVTPNGGERATIRVDGTGEVVRDFLGVPKPAPPAVILTGVVVEASPGGTERPVSKARVQGKAADSGTFRATADEGGRFEMRRPDQDIILYASGANGVAAVKVAKGVNEVRIVLAAGVTASGRVVDAGGRPFVGQGPNMRMLAGPGGLPGLRETMYMSKFEQGGRYQFERLFPGAEYEVSYVPDANSGGRDILRIGRFRVDGPGPIDLGDFAVPASADRKGVGAKP